ncbi:MAG: ATP-binding protein, partial [Gemmatimonadota bacterium]
METGNARVGRESLLRLERHGAVEDTYWTFVYAPLRENNGETNKVIAICNEVTAEVQARELVARSEARYRRIFESVGVSIWDEDFSAVKAALDELQQSGVQDLRRYFAEHPEFVRRAIGLVRVRAVNQATMRMFQAEDEQALMESLATVFVPETEAVFAEELITIAEGRTHFEAEAVLRTLAGERRNVLFTMALPKEDPELRRVLVTLTDITERKRAEEALVENARVLETLNRAGRALAAEMDLDRIMQAVTDAATEVAGAEYGVFFRNVVSEAGEAHMLYTYSGAEREAFEGLDRTSDAAVFGPSLSGEGPVRLTDITADPRYERKALHLPLRSYLAVPVKSRSGEVIGGLVLGHRDVGVFTERSERLVVGIATQAAVAIDNARLYEQSLQLIGKLQDSDRQKDEFLATLSHELRNPLAPLRNSLHLLRLAGGQSSSAASIHEMMGRQVNHLVRLVDDLLEMSRISRGTFELRRERVQLAAIVGNAVETSDPLLRAAGHTLRVDLPHEPVWIDGDPVRLAQILANLLNNAAKYTNSGGKISVTAHKVQNHADVTVRDNGSGISPEALPHVFEMFSRGDRSSGRDQTGLGIGLALARRLVEMHGGTITAHSAGLGKGSEFTVRIPLARDQLTHTTPSERTTAAITRKRILVVDDNRDSAESLRMLLEFLGADVRVAFDGEGALAALKGYDPAVVFLDIGMPDLDGYEVARRMRAQFPDRKTTIVALTGWGQEEDRRKAREAGFDRHLIKPADVGALQALLGSLEEHR